MDMYSDSLNDAMYGQKFTPEATTDEFIQGLIDFANANLSNLALVGLGVGLIYALDKNTIQVSKKQDVPLSVVGLIPLTVGAVNIVTPYIGVQG